MELSAARILPESSIPISQRVIEDTHRKVIEDTHRNVHQYRLSAGKIKKMGVLYFCCTSSEADRVFCCIENRFTLVRHRGVSLFTLRKSFSTVRIALG
ncbi:MAG: hypothetical protein ACI9JM_001108 [Halioglobus sp.]|jgi:hypothetical protein